MRLSRNLLLVLLFLGLTALEIAQGVARLNSLQFQHEEELLAAIERRQHDLATGLGTLLASSREHVTYLARLPEVLQALRTGSGRTEVPPELTSHLLPYLVSFRGIDRVRLLDRAGIERFRTERIGNAVGVLPGELLQSEPDVSLLELAARTGPGGVGMSSLVVDHRRVEVPEQDRKVLHFAQSVHGPQGETLGVVVLTVYANPLLDVVRRFEPLPGASSFLVDEKDSYLAHSERERESAFEQGSGFKGEAATRIAMETGVMRDADAAYVATRVSESPRWTFITRIPGTVTAAAAADRFHSEYLWIIATIVVITAILAGAMFFLLRLSIREFRLRESQHLLAQIARESEKYHTLLEGAADMILVIDPDRLRVREMNARARHALGTGGGESPAGAEAIPLDRIFARDDLARVEQGMRDALLRLGSLVALGDLSVRASGGKLIPADARIAAMQLGEERVVQVSLRDLTHEKELAQQLRVAERLGALGVLTAGVAHEINNPLEGIGNYLALAERPGTSEDKRKQYFSQVRQGLERIRVIVRDLATIGRPQASVQAADLGDAVRAALGLLATHADFREVAVQLQGLERPVWVLGEAARLEQVFTNLFINAARAMAGRGNIFVTAARANGTGNRDQIEIVVEDDGPGISTENLERVFDPFFTTGGGSGLGLAICYSIVRIHGGSMSAGNRTAGGARFAITLPCGEPGSALPRTKG